MWRCKACGATTRDDDTRLRRKREECTGLNARITSTIQAAESLGHSILVGVVDDTAMYACTRCGGRAATRPQKLLDPCNGCKTEYGARSVKAFQHLIDPNGRGTLERTWSAASARKQVAADAIAADDERLAQHAFTGIDVQAEIRRREEAIKGRQLGLLNRIRSRSLQSSD